MFVRRVMKLTLCVVLLGVMRVDAADRAVVVTSDYATGSVAVLNLETQQATSNLLTIHSDAAVRTHNGRVYVINRLGQDNILVLDGADLSQPVLQFSVGPGTNPQGIAFASNEKAYVARLQARSLLIVNPATGDSLGSISLSDFADADGMAEPAHLATYNGHLYVTCQRGDKNDFFAPTDYSAIAVIDMATDQVVDVDPAQAGVQGIRLSLKNPISQVLVGHYLYVSAVGSWSDFADGGIERVNLRTHQAEGALIGEGDLGGNVGSLALVDTSRAYVVVSDQTFANAVKIVNLGTGQVSGALPDISGGYTPAIAIFKGRLYVADQGQFGTAGTTGVRIFDVASNAQVAGPIGTGLPPVGMAFLTDSAGGPADFNGDGVVDFSDFLLFAAGFGRSTGDAGFDARLDLSGDGVVDFSDFLIFVAAFGK